jgi:predicted DNA binding CopG/RHH family protein
MKRSVKSEKGYEKSFDADWKAVQKGLKKVRAEVGEPKKIPTSIALDPRFVLELKKEAQSRGIPYQVLMRMFIVEGFQRLKKKSA